MKTLRIACTLVFVLSGMAIAQTGPVLRRMHIPHIAASERADTIIDYGALVFDEDDPSLVYVGDGETPGGVLVTPSIAPWDHEATRDINLAGYALRMSSIYSVETSEDGFSVQSGGVRIVTISGGEVSGQIDNLAFADGEYTLTVHVGTNAALPVIEHTFDLVDGEWVTSTMTSISDVTDAQRTLTIDEFAGENTVFFRMILPSANPDISVLGNVEITGDLTVTGSIPGAYSYETIFAEESQDIDEAMAAVNGYQWSFGNGDETPQNQGWLNLRDGAEVVAIGLQITEGDVTVELVKNGTPTGHSVQASGTAAKAVNDSMTPVSLDKTDTINFRTTSASGNTDGGRVFALIRRAVQ